MCPYGQHISNDKNNQGPNKQGCQSPDLQDIVLALIQLNHTNIFNH